MVLSRVIRLICLEWWSWSVVVSMVFRLMVLFLVFV